MFGKPNQRVPDSLIADIAGQLDAGVDRKTIKAGLGYSDDWANKLIRRAERARIRIEHRISGS